MLKNLLPRVMIKPKPWGREIWFAWTDRYAGKILEIKKGHRFSLQYHEKKSETQFVVAGRVKFSFGKSAKKMRSKIIGPGGKIDISAKMIHRAQALTAATLFEVSSPELDDVVKLDDDYGRIGKGNNEILDRRLAK